MVNKDQLATWLEEGQLDAVVRQAEREKRTLSLLSALLYHPDPLVSWRAAEGMGLAAQAVARRSPEYVRGHLRRLFWLLNDESGGIGWRAPEAIGEIIYHCPGLFDDFISPLFFLLDMEAEDAPRFRTGILYAIGRMGPRVPEVFSAVLRLIMTCLDDAQPQTRGAALWCLRQNSYSGPLSRLPILTADTDRVELYQDGRILLTTVAELAQPWIGVQ